MAMHHEVSAVLRQISKDRPAPAPFELNLATINHAALSYAVGGEDLVLRKLLKPHLRDKRVYVDIGCYTPAAGSNTYQFYCLGWSGLCVDANSELVPYWQQIRPRDKFVVAAVSDIEGTTRLNHHPKNHGMHRVADVEPLPEHTPGPEVVRRRLDSLFEEHIGEAPIHLMSMDIEGSEMSALRSNDWNRWRPLWIIIEAIESDITNLRSHEALAFLFDLGYRAEAKIHDNVILQYPG
jgi:FkbM family methyltransferase